MKRRQNVLNGQVLKTEEPDLFETPYESMWGLMPKMEVAGVCDLIHTDKDALNCR